MSVSGIGGFVFRAADPDGLRAWYAEHLGIGTGEHGEWATTAGPSVFAPFPRDSDYFAVDRQWMLNLRVDGLDAMLEALAAAGIEVTTNPDWDMPARPLCPHPRSRGQSDRALGTRSGGRRRARPNSSLRIDSGCWGRAPAGKEVERFGRPAAHVGVAEALGPGLVVADVVRGPPRTEGVAAGGKLADEVADRGRRADDPPRSRRAAGHCVNRRARARAAAPAARRRACIPASSHLDPRSARCPRCEGRRAIGRRRRPGSTAWPETGRATRRRPAASPHPPTGDRCGPGDRPLRGP